MDISDESVRELYSLHRNIERGETTRQHALVTLSKAQGLNSTSATFMLGVIDAMLKGEVYQRTANLYAHDYFLERIAADYGDAALGRAIRAARLHVAYFDGRGKGSLSSLTRKIDEHEERLASRAAARRAGPALIPAIAAELNRRAPAYRIGGLQELRVGLQGLARRPGTDIFTEKTTFPDWAFHHGGRSELQFNLGSEDEGERVRHGMAFSFETSRALPSVDVLIPKVRRFNDYLRMNPGVYPDMLMWHYDNDVRSDDRTPEPVSDKLLKPGVFVFLGKSAPAGDVSYDDILTDFDRLLPLYTYVEGGAAAPEPEARRGFVFKPGCPAKASATKATPAQRQHDVTLRHNTLQQALYAKLVVEHGEDNVGGEIPNGPGTSVDMVVRSDGYWFYEIKTALSARACLREALGQLLEYAYWPGCQVATRLVVVGESPLDETASAYVATLRDRFNLPIEYEQVIA